MDHINPTEMCSVPTLFTEPTLSVHELIALALDHRVQAERSASPTEQRELHRVADIYTVLATIDIPIALLEQLAP
jgi:hypothetical protein